MGVTNKRQLLDWGAVQKIMYNPSRFINSLRTFDIDNIKPEQKAALKTPDLLLNPIFTFEYMMRRSSAAANLANWVICIIRINDIINEARNFPK